MKAAGALLLLALAGIAPAIATVTARHQARAERLARCRAEVGLHRQADPRRVARLERFFADGGPTAPCDLAEALKR